VKNIHAYLIESYAAFHWALKLVFPNSYFWVGSRDACRIPEFPSWKYHFRLQWNDISYWETRKYIVRSFTRSSYTRKYEFPSPVECSIIYWSCCTSRDNALSSLCQVYHQ